MSKISNEPQIRFKDFMDAWEQRKLGEVGTTYTGLSGKTKEDFGHGNGQFVTYMNVFSNAVASSEMVEPVEIDDRQNKVFAGDVLFTTSSETPEEVGMSSVWIENSQNTYLNSFCFGYRPRIPFDPYYLAFMLRSSLMRKKITFLAQGISRYNISKNKMMDIEIPVPMMSEQHQIGEYFRNLDNLIALHQRKYDQAVNFKKAMLEKMFPKNGSDTPEIRFKNYIKNPNLKWSEKVLGENASIITGGTPRTEVDGYWNPKEIPWLSSGEVHKKRVTQTDDKISQEGLKNSSAKWVGKDAILVALAGQGKTRGTVAITEIPITTNQSVAAIELDDSLSPEFVYQNLESRYEELRMKSSGDGTRGGLNKEILSGITIKAPEKREQIDIGEFLRVLDRLVYLNFQKLIKLKNIKKALLEKMFV